ncbi:MAG: hypothetical protein ACK4UN_01050 [Limisphaerales bacterium]
MTKSRAGDSPEEDSALKIEDGEQTYGFSEPENSPGDQPRELFRPEKTVGDLPDRFSGVENSPGDLPGKISEPAFWRGE